jgi:anti-sigma factor RsiW
MAHASGRQPQRERAVSGRVLQLDPAAHKVADVLLPWFVNGTLESDERAFVERHLEQCVRCQREVEWLRDLHAACIAAEGDPGASAAARKLRRRFEEPRHERTIVAAVRRLWSRLRPWSHWVAAMELAVIVLLGAWMALGHDDAAPYRTLSAKDAGASANAGGNIVVVFDPQTTEADLRRILRDAGAHIVGGPTRANAYVLEVPPQRQDQALQSLRSERAAALVEQLSSRNAQ